MNSTSTHNIRQLTEEEISRLECALNEPIERDYLADPQHEHHGLAVRPDTLMGPGVKFAFVSYIQRLSDDHGESCRRLVQLEWYQRRWGDRVRLNTAQKSYFDNSAGGSRRASSFSSITGFDADIIVVDDAHDIKTVESNKVRELTVRTWDEVLQTRLNDPKTGIHRDHAAQP